MTELEFHFHTGVEFSAPVSGHTFALHCLPVEDDAQKLQSYAVRIEPAAEYGLHRDGFGGWLVCGSCREPHTVFCYDSHGIVRVDGRAQAEPVNPVLKQFTPLTAMTAELETLWQSLPLDGKTLQEQAALLNKAAAAMPSRLLPKYGTDTTGLDSAVFGDCCGDGQLLRADELCQIGQLFAGHVLVRLVYAGKRRGAAYLKGRGDDDARIGYARRRERAYIHFAGAPCDVARGDVHAAALGQKLNIHAGDRPRTNKALIHVALEPLAQGRSA